MTRPHPSLLGFGGMLSAASKAGWRSSGSLPSKATNAKRSGPSYRERREGPRWEGSAARLLKLFLLALAVPALLLAWMATFVDRPATPMLLLSVAAYQAPVPPNAFAAEDQEHFRLLFTEAGYKNLSLTSAPASDGIISAPQLQQELTSFFQGVHPGGPDKNVVIVYLSAHGLVNDDGAPCLLLPDDNALDPSKWLKLSDLLSTVNNAAKAKNCSAVLLLDAHRIDDQWQMGVFANTFSVALANELQSPLSNCLVLAAASGMQPALAAPELSATPFGYFAALGLRGMADAEGGDEDAVVTVAELAQYVSQQTAAWTTTHRGTAQRPQLFANDEQQELELVDVADTGSVAAPSTSWKPPVSELEFDKLFDDVAKLENPTHRRLSPLEWARVQLLLQRLDDECLAGAAYAQAAKTTLSTLHDLVPKLASAKAWPIEFQPPSLALTGSIEDAPPQLADIWAKWKQDPARAKPELAADYATVARFVWRELTSGLAPVTRTDLADSLKFCGWASSPPGVEFTEMALLRLLDAWLDWNSPALASGLPRALLAVRREAEELVAASDPRVHYLLAPGMSAADREFNLALDQLLIGDAASISDAGQRLSALQAPGKGYASLRSLAAQMQRAWEVRDEALSAALVLHRTSVRRARWDLQEREDAVKYQTLVDGMLRLSQALDQAVSRAPSLSAEAQRDLATQTDAVAASVKALLDEYSQRVKDVAEYQAGSTSPASREQPALLRCMLRFDSLRASLHKQWFHGSSGNNAIAVASQPADPAGGAPLDDSYLTWLATDGARPLEQLLSGLQLGGDVATATAPLQAIAAHNARLRKAILGCEAECRARADRLQAERAATPAAVARAGLSEADLLSRALGSVAGAEMHFTPAEAPAQQLHLVDAQAWLAWQGRRIVDDCWGSLAGGDQKKPPYFQVAAERLAAAAKALTPVAVADVEQLLTACQNQVRLIDAWKPLTVERLLVNDQAGALQPQTLVFSEQSQLPDGNAAVFLSSRASELFPTTTPDEQDVRRSPANVRKAAQFNVYLNSQRIVGVSSLLANVLFRGHYRAAPFNIGRGRTIEWARPAPAEASVLVTGDAEQETQVVFILDCSKSMGYKLEQGKKALQSLLSMMLEQTQGRQAKYQVGLVFYGRRAGWGQAENGQFEIVPKGSTVRPGEDVEEALPPTLLDGQSLASIEAKLATAVPRGETPLYLAIIRSIELFDLSKPCRLISITDGVNDVWSGNPPDVVRKSDQDVITLLNSRGVKGKVHVKILQFGDDKAAYERASRLKEWALGKTGLKNIIESTKPAVSFDIFEDVGSLSRELQASLRLERYRLQAVNADNLQGVKVDNQLPAQTPWRELGEKTSLDPLDAIRAYEIRLETSRPTPPRLELEGGETVEAVYRASANQLLFQPYLDDVRDVQPAGNATVTAHMSKGVPDSPVFRLSLQRQDERQFSRRPDVIWAKVESMQQRQMQPYYFFDRVFEPARPAPVLALHAADWRGGDKARIELCFLDDQHDLPSGCDWKSIDATCQAYGDRLRINRERIDQGVQFVVEETHPRDDGEYPLHIQFDPPPDAVSRTFFDADRFARHVFRYAHAQEPPDVRVRVITKSDIEQAGGQTVVFPEIERPQ